MEMEEPEEKKALVEVVKRWLKYDNEIRTLQQEMLTRKRAKQETSAILMNMMKEVDLNLLCIF
jgi:hypothetical protein